MNTKKYEIQAVGNATAEFPTDSVYILLWCNEEDAIEVPKQYPFEGVWGETHEENIYIESDHEMPRSIDLAYLSIVEQKFYSLEKDLPTDKMIELWENKKDNKKENIFQSILVGMAPYGKIAIWLHGEKKQVLIDWLECEETHIDIEDYMPTAPELTLQEVCSYYINNNTKAKKNLQDNGLPSRNFFEAKMKQYVYRYNILFSEWNDKESCWINNKKNESKEELNYIEEELYDGTYDKLHELCLMKYHKAGKPKKLELKWHEGKHEYYAIIKFDEDGMNTIFKKIYGIHNDTQVDFNIFIDSSKNKYEVSLYRYGLEEQLTISESHYQMMVFRNGFECFRSKNYNK